MAPRAYDANAARLLRRSTLVYDADDIRRNIRLCLDEGRPCNLKLAGDIPIDRGFIIPGRLPSFSLDGGARYRLILTADADFLFSLKGGGSSSTGCPVDLANLVIRLKTGVTVTEAFVVYQALTVFDLQTKSLTLRRVTIDGSAGTISNVFSMGTTGTLGRVVADGLTLRGVTNIFAAGSNLTSWLWCRLTDVLVEGIGLADATWGLGSLSPAFIEGVFQRIAGSINVDTGGFSTSNFWCVIFGNGANTFTTHNPTGGRPQTLARVDNFASKSLSVDDIDLDAAAGGGSGLTSPQVLARGLGA